MLRHTPNCSEDLKTLAIRSEDYKYHLDQEQEAGARRSGEKAGSVVVPVSQTAPTEERKIPANITDEKEYRKITILVVLFTSVSHTCGKQTRKVVEVQTKNCGWKDNYGDCSCEEEEKYNV